MQSAGLIKGLPPRNAADFPEGCFVPLAKNILEDFPKFTTKDVLRLCQSFHRHTDFGVVLSEIEYDRDEVLEWLDIRHKQMSFEEFLMERRNPEIMENAFDLAFSKIEKDFSAVMNLSRKNRELLKESFYSHIVGDFNLQAEGGPDLRLNLLLTFGSEAATEMRNVQIMSYILEDMENASEWVMGNNALSWLIHQQGYTVKDFLEGKKSPFLDSLHKELTVCPPSPSHVTVCCHAKADTLSKLDMNCRCGMPIALGNDVTVGIFSPYMSEGTDFGIILERPLVIHQKMIFDVQIENSGCMSLPQFKTTVGDALKLPDEAWARAEVREASPDDRFLVLERFDARGDVLDAEEFQANLEASISLDIEDDDSAGMTVH